MSSTPLGHLIAPARTRRAGSHEYPVLSMTMHGGLVDQSEKFKKRIASADTSDYKVVSRGQLVVGFPIDEGVLDFQDLYDAAIVSPAYGIWDLKSGSTTDAAYLSRYLRSPRAISYYKGRLRGSTARRRSLPASIFLELEVPTPPVDEQRRIARLLDRADGLRLRRQQLLTAFDELKQSMFATVFSTASPIFKLGDLGEVQGGLQVSKKREILPLERSYLRVANVYRGALDLGEVKMMRVTEAEARRVTLQKDDLLFVEGHANPKEVGRVARWDGSVADCLHQNHLIRVRLDTAKVEPIYVEAWFNTHQGSMHFQRAGKTTSGLNTINASQLRAAPIPIPPMELQRSYLELVDRVNSQVEEQRALIGLSDELLAALETRAFLGEL